MEIRVRGYGKSWRAGYNECNVMWKKKIKEKIERYNTYGEQPYADETINNIVISELKELLKGE